MGKPDLERRAAGSPRRSFLSGPWPAALLAAACFANSSFNEFAYDDNAIVQFNERIQSLTNFHDIWLRDWWAGLLEDNPLDDPARDRLYRPLSMYTFAINYAIHGTQPAGYHLFNIALHVATCMLVWSLTRRLFHDDAVASLAAVIFAVHPVHAEAVAGVVGRAEELSAFFFLIGLVTLLPRARHLGVARLIGASLAFFAAILSKETAICYPLVALIVLQPSWTSDKTPRRRRIFQALLPALPLAIYFPLRNYALEGRFIRDELTGILMNPLNGATLWERIHGPFTIFGEYVRLLLAPSSLSCDYGLAIFDPSTGITAMTLLGICGGAALLYALWGYRSRSPLRRNVALAAAIFLASYALISNTVLLIGVSLAERLMYWPSVPICMLLGLLLVSGWRRFCAPGGALEPRAKLLRVCGVLLLAALGARSVVRNADWKSDAALLTADATAHPEGAHLSNVLAEMLLEQAQHASGPRRAALIQKAFVLTNRALRIKPRFHLALRNRGFAYLLSGDREQAERDFTLAIQLNPADRLARKQLARMRSTASDVRPKIAALEQDVKQSPDDVAKRVELGNLLIEVGRHFDAIQHFEKAYALAPRNVDVLRGYGQALLVNLQNDAARRIFEKLIKLAPDDWQTHANLVTLLATHDPAAALRHALAAYRLQPNDLRNRINLAEAYASNGRVDEALREFSNIVASIDPSDPYQLVIRDRMKELRRR